jgi:hypothetical protein
MTKAPAIAGSSTFADDDNEESSCQTGWYCWSRSRSVSGRPLTPHVLEMRRMGAAEIRMTKVWAAEIGWAQIVVVACIIGDLCWSGAIAVGVAGRVRRRRACGWWGGRRRGP